MKKTYLILDWDEFGNPLPRISECFPLSEEGDILYVYAINGSELNPVRIMGRYTPGIDRGVHGPCPCSDVIVH